MRASYTPCPLQHKTLLLLDVQAIRREHLVISLVVLLAGGLIGLGYRVAVEERALVDALGQPYEDYMRQTRRLIPFIY